jgi:hypothetical protein
MPVMPVIETPENCHVHIFSSKPDYHRVIGISYCSVYGYAMYPDCGSHNVEHLSRVTGYVGNIKAFNSAKQQEVKDRHSVSYLRARSLIIRTHRNYGSMSNSRQNQANKKHPVGFHFIYQDGYQQDIWGGLLSIPDQTTQEHGHAMTAKAIERGNVNASTIIEKYTHHII